MSRTSKAGGITRERYSPHYKQAALALAERVGVRGVLGCRNPNSSDGEGRRG